MSEPTFILLTESPAQSWKRDASTYAFAFACFVPGWYLDMVSMSLLGALLLVFMVGRSVLEIGSRPLTPDQARDKIAEIERTSKERPDGRT